MAKPFRATAAATVNIDVSGSSQRVLVSNAAGETNIRIENNGTATVWFAFGDATVTASVTADQPIPAGAIEVQTAAPPQGAPLYVACIAASTTGKIYFTPGAGI